MKAMADAIIEIRGLRKHYGTFEALKGIDIRVERGELFARIDTAWFRPAKGRPFEFRLPMFSVRLQPFTRRVNREAAHYYHQLRTEFADEVCLDGKTGQQLYDTLPATSPIRTLPYTPNASPA